MQLDEAIAIRQSSLHGREVQRNLLAQALRVIDRGNAISLGQRDIWRPEPIHDTQRDRINMVLAFRLALACGKLRDWQAGRIEERKAA